MAACGTYTGALDDKVKLANLRLQPAQNVRPPVIVDALGRLECRVTGQVPTGDHTLFVGQIVHAEAQAHAFTDAWTSPAGDALLCLQRDRFGCGCFGESNNGN